MKRNFKIIAIITLALCALLLGGCKKNRDDVKLTSTLGLRLYAWINYGAASSYEVTEEDYKRTVTFTDRQYGFTYQVSSYSASVGFLDAEPFGYTERKYTDFPERYFYTIASLAAENFSSRCEPGSCGCSDDENTFSIYHVSIEDAANITQEIAEYLDDLDTRRFFRKKELRVQAYLDEGENYYGSWHSSDETYYYYADERIKSMIIRAKSDTNRAGYEEKEVTFLYWEQMRLSDVPGLEEWELCNEDLDADHVVTLYWFDIDGAKHFYADVQVWNISNVYYSDTLVKIKKN